MPVSDLFAPCGFGLFNTGILGVARGFGREGIEGFSVFGLAIGMDAFVVKDGIEGIDGFVDLLPIDGIDCFADFEGRDGIPRFILFVLGLCFVSLYNKLLFVVYVVWVPPEVDAQLS